MEYEDKLALLVSKKNSWTHEKRIEYYGLSTPPNIKYGTDWSYMWEETDAGVVVMTQKYQRTSLEYILYGNDGKFYSLSEEYGEHDWDLLREMYIHGSMTGDFRTEVPVFYSVVNLSDSNWAFTVTAAPNGDMGNTIYTSVIESGDDSNYHIQSIYDIETVAKTMWPLCEKYGVGMSQQIFCFTNLWENGGGRYFRLPGRYTYTFTEARNLGIAMLKVTTIKKWNLLKTALGYNGMTDKEATEYIELAKLRWSL